MQHNGLRCVYRSVVQSDNREGKPHMSTLIRVLFLGLLAVSLNLSAGEKGNKEGKGGGMGMGKRTPEIDLALDHAKELNLTPEQKKKLNDLKNKVEDQREKAMKDPETRELFKETMAARKSGDEEKLKQLQQKVREKMAAKGGGEDLSSEFVKILQPDQLAKLKELREAEGGPRGGKMAGGGGGKGAAPEGKKPDASKGVPSIFDNEK